MTLSSIRFDLHVDGDGVPTIRPVIDGRDFLAGHANDRGLHPERVLPPLSNALYPITAGRNVMVGSCDCGETGCGSLSLRIRRAGDEVVWEPGTRYDETIRQSYRFALIQYLDALDGAERPGEGLGSRTARGVRLALAGYDQRYESLTPFHTAGVDWISAWPWSSDTVNVSITKADQQTVHEFIPEPGESDDDFGRRVLKAVGELRTAR